MKGQLQWPCSFVDGTCAATPEGLIGNSNGSGKGLIGGESFKDKDKDEAMAGSQSFLAFESAFISLQRIPRLPRPLVQLQTSAKLTPVLWRWKVTCASELTHALSQIRQRISPTRQAAKGSLQSATLWTVSPDFMLSFQCLKGPNFTLRYKFTEAGALEFSFDKGEAFQSWFLTLSIRLAPPKCSLLALCFAHYWRARGLSSVYYLSRGGECRNVQLTSYRRGVAAAIAGRGVAADLWDFVCLSHC